MRHGTKDAGRPLTARQRQVVMAVMRLTATKGYPPTQQELADRFGIRLQVMQRRLVTLERKGYVRRTKGVARGLRVVREPD